MRYVYEYRVDVYGGRLNIMYLEDIACGMPHSAQDGGYSAEAMITQRIENYALRKELRLKSYKECIRKFLENQ